MFGLLLLTVQPIPPGIWKWCSGIAFVVSFSFAIRMTKTFRSLNLRDVQRDRTTRFVFYLFGIFGIAVILLQVYNLGLLGAFWPFFTAIVYQLLTGVFQFARLILLLPE